jgi:hypothetical protein
VPIYDFGAVQVATFALLTFTALLGSRCCGVVTVKILGDAVIFRSSPTVFGTSTRNLIWQGTESYMERGDAFGLVPHKLYDIAQPA